MGQRQFDISGHHTKEDSVIVSSIFGSVDVSRVSRGAMIRRLAQQTRALQKITLELYCEAPKHSLFAKSEAQQLAHYEEERMKREAARLDAVRGSGFVGRLKEWFAKKLGERLQNERIIYLDE